MKDYFIGISKCTWCGEETYLCKCDKTKPPELSVERPREEEKPICKGKVYKCKENMFINKKGEIIFKQTFVPMKKLSCDGCESCGWIDDTLRESVEEDYFVLSEDEVYENNELYYICATNIERDWESGLVDAWDLTLKKMGK